MPSTIAQNVTMIGGSYVHPPVPAGYHDINDVIAEREKSPQRAAALVRARQRLAKRTLETEKKITIASLRLAGGLSQIKVAALLNSTQPNYSRIESGKTTDMNLSTAKRLSEIFGVDLTAIDNAFSNTKALNR